MTGLWREYVIEKAGRISEQYQKRMRQYPEQDPSEPDGPCAPDFFYLLPIPHPFLLIDSSVGKWKGTVQMSLVNTNDILTLSLTIWKFEVPPSG